MVRKPKDRQFIDGVSEAVFIVDTDCRITAFNPAAEALTGFGEKEVLGRACSEILQSDICMATCAAKESLASGERVDRRYVRMRGRDGSILPISLSTSPLRDPQGRLSGAVETVRSLSCAESETETLNREMVRHKSILENLTEGVVTVDRDWRVATINGAAERMLGQSRDGAVGRKCSDVLGTESCSSDRSLERVLAGSVPIRDERLFFSRADRTPIEVSLNARVLKDAEGAVLGSVLSFREFTEVDRLRIEFSGEQHFRGMIGKSPAMRAVFHLLEDVAESSSTVLITGESGTGKKTLAECIQQLGPRRQAPFVTVNCAAFSDGLLQSELFGQARGTLARVGQDRLGRFQIASGGTIYLESIGDLSPATQARLLQVVQKKQVEPVGSDTPLAVDVRIIASTRRPLFDLVRATTFREDLYYSLNVIPVHLPPLRRRREDIPLLVEHFMRKYRRITGKPMDRIHRHVLDLFVSHPWPGNVRQLENAVEYAFSRTRGSVLTLDLLPPDVRNRNAGEETAQEGGPVGEALEIIRALERHRWHHRRAAEELGMSRTTLWRRMKKHGIESSR